MKEGPFPPEQGDCKVVEGRDGGKPAGVLHPFGCASRGVSPKLNLLLARAIAKYLLQGKRYFAIALAPELLQK